MHIPSKNQIIAILGALFLLPVLYYTVDLGFNSKRFVSRDFSAAFLARKTGNCELFRSYIANQYNDDWVHKCYMEKQGSDLAVSGFRVLEIQVDGDDAYLQVHLERPPYKNEKIEPYTVTYQMLRVRNFMTSKWIINQKKALNKF